MKLAFCIVAIVLFILATLPLSEPYSGRMLPLGLAFLAASLCLPI
jgi:hypothetical protein